MNDNTLILEVTQEENGIQIDLTAKGFTPLEVIGILEKVKQSYIKNETEQN